MARGRRSGGGNLNALVSRQVEALVTSIVQLVRENTVNEISSLLTSSSRGPVGKTRPAHRRKFDLGCIASQCANRSKGPRFRFLCEKHLGASKKQITAWREARRKAARQE